MSLNTFVAVLEKKMLKELMMEHEGPVVVGKGWKLEVAPIPYIRYSAMSFRTVSFKNIGVRELRLLEMCCLLC